MAQFIVKASTPDHEIAAKLTSEEVLERFDGAKEHANRWDAERDRLRTYIQEHLPTGRYGSYVLVKKEGTPRVYSSTLGNKMIQTGLVIDLGLFGKPPKGGQKVSVVTETGEVIAEGITVSNSELFSKKPPINISLTEVPDEPETD